MIFPMMHVNPEFIDAFPIKSPFLKASSRLLQFGSSQSQEFLVEFIDAHYEAYEGPTLRDGMDQRVFNKFVMSNRARRLSVQVSLTTHGDIEEIGLYSYIIMCIYKYMYVYIYMDYDSGWKNQIAEVSFFFVFLWLVRSRWIHTYHM